jgi:TPR repeat protein
LEQAAELGSGEAAEALGSWYLFGVHFEKDVERAIEKWERAAQLGNKEAMFNLGLLFERDDEIEADLPRSFLNYLKAALHGHAGATYELGRFFYYGTFVPENMEISYFLEDHAKSLGYIEPEDEDEGEDDD